MDVGNSELTFAEAFDSDLKTYGLEQSRVCELLSVGDEVPISSAAISNWKRRNTLPLSRLDKLVEIFGPDCQTSRFRLQVINGMGDPARRKRERGITEVKQQTRSPQQGMFTRRVEQLGSTVG